MRRLLPIVPAVLCILSCHINEVAEDILELELSDSLKTCARLDIALTNTAGTTPPERVWSAPPPDPLVIRHVLAPPRPVDFRVRIACVDGLGEVTTVKTIPYRDGNPGTVHVVHGSAPRFRISAFKLLDSVDADGDGHARRYRTLLDVDGNTNFDTLRLTLAYRVQGNPLWFPLIPSRRLPVAGAATADTQIVSIEGGARRTLSLKAQIRTAAGDSLDEALIESLREETPGQDSAGLRWVFYNHTGVVLDLDGEVGARTVDHRKVEPDDSVVVSLSSKNAAEKIVYTAVAQAPGEPVAWAAEGNMEMNRFGVEVEALTSDSYFVLRLRNGSGQAISALILNPGTPSEKSYPVDLPGGPDWRDLGLYPYVTGTTLAVRLADGATLTYNDLEFESDPTLGFRYADLAVGP